MSQVYQLDRVMRRVMPDYVTFDPAERIVIVDAKRRSIVPKKPLFTFADLRFFSLLTSNDARNVATGQINGFQLQDLSHALTVSIAYEVRCKPGSEMRVALALFDEVSSPGEILERAITRWLVELGQIGIAEFVRAYLRDKSTLEAKLAAKALIETGLELNARLFIDAERSLNPIIVTKDHLRVLVSDYRDEHQDLDVRVTLDVDDAQKANAILAFRFNTQLHELVPKEIVRFVRENVTMEAFCTHLNAPEVRDPLSRHLDGVLAPYGRRVGGIRLDAKTPPLAFFVQKLVNVPCRLYEYPEEVVIANEVQMVLRDIAQYKSAGAPDPGEWLQARLRQVIPQLLFGVKYIEVLIRFSPYEDKIKRSLSSDAAAIGYEIKHLITVPDLEPIRLKDAFALNASGTFELRLTNFFVTLQVIITARIPRLETIEQHLNRLQNVPRLMEDAVVTLTRNYLHGVDPERFYMRFGFTEIEGEQAVEHELVGKIRDELTGAFGAEVIDVVVKVGDTDIIKRLRALQNEICPFTVEIKSLQPSDSTWLEGNFQVDMVDGAGWSRFQQLTIDVKHIGQLLEQHLYAQLQAAPPELIQFRDPRQQQGFVGHVAGLAVKYMREQFGLIIRVSNVRRRRTTVEEGTAQTLLEESAAILKERRAAIQAWVDSDVLTTAQRLARMDLLLKERQRLSITTGSEEEVAELDRRVAEETRALKPERLSTFEEVQSSLLPRRPKALTIGDLDALAGLAEPASGQTRRPEESAE
ncbi:MAG TPA: hypothetical protein VF824_17440 [Thermoanaerobaculia bacterium]|jgi:hypothetical protein